MTSVFFIRKACHSSLVKQGIFVPLLGTSILVYPSVVNAEVQGMAKWIEFNQTVICCASVQSAFPAVVACYAVFLNLSCSLDIMRQQQLTFNCMGNRLLGLQMFLRSSFQGLIVQKWVNLGLLWFAKRRFRCHIESSAAFLSDGQQPEAMPFSFL